MNNWVFLDASFWIALRDMREPAHSQAVAMTRQLLSMRQGFVFTSFILAETYAYFSRSLKMRLQILDDAEKNPVMRWEPVLAEDEQEARRLLRRYADKSFSYCDAVSFALMRRLGLERAATFDKHFRQIGGFGIIGPPQSYLEED
ncbi:MAG: PIN domain-containing protein [Verrucomicrobiae bacterium]|nr:PIN domain-containing protein [Verrucomicrobiae bacterium]